MKLRAYAVYGATVLVGWLGEGSGPFRSASSSELPSPSLPHARFTSQAFPQENVVAEVLTTTKTFDAAVAELKKRGLHLEKVEYESVFQAARNTPTDDPAASGSGAP